MPAGVPLMPLARSRAAARSGPPCRSPRTAAAAGMDEGEPGAKQRGAPGPRVERARGRASAKQKARKRKSLDKALAVADRAETKVAKRGGAAAANKALKKL